LRNDCQSAAALPAAPAVFFVRGGAAKKSCDIIAVPHLPTCPTFLCTSPRTKVNCGKHPTAQAFPMQFPKSLETTCQVWQVGRKPTRSPHSPTRSTLARRPTASGSGSRRWGNDRPVSRLGARNATHRPAGDGPPPARSRPSRRSRLRGRVREDPPTNGSPITASRQGSCSTQSRCPPSLDAATSLANPGNRRQQAAAVALERITAAFWL
jgi:hypothetical protein